MDFLDPDAERYEAPFHELHHGLVVHVDHERCGLVAGGVGVADSFGQHLNRPRRPLVRRLHIERGKLYGERRRADCLQPANDLSVVAQPEARARFDGYGSGQG